jgi:hypothetical protein
LLGNICINTLQKGAKDDDDDDDNDDDNNNNNNNNNNCNSSYSYSSSYSSASPPSLFLPASTYINSMQVLRTANSKNENTILWAHDPFHVQTLCLDAGYLFNIRIYSITG